MQRCTIFPASQDKPRMQVPLLIKPVTCQSGAVCLILQSLLALCMVANLWTNIQVEIFLVLDMMDDFQLKPGHFLLWDWILFKPSVSTSFLLYCSGWEEKWEHPLLSARWGICPHSPSCLCWLSVESLLLIGGESSGSPHRSRWPCSGEVGFVTAGQLWKSWIPSRAPLTSLQWEKVPCYCEEGWESRLPVLSPPTLWVEGLFPAGRDESYGLQQ